MKILLTGGAGYVGSHTAVALSDAGHEVVLMDNFCNSSLSVLERLEKILGKKLTCIEADVRETEVVERVLREHKIDAVIHFAGLKAVGESVEKPIEYYANNVQGAISLLEAMRLVNVKTLVFSSSATVYGDPQYLPINESHPTNPTNPYGRSKLYIEDILKDLSASDSEWKIVCLRYFNPVGAHESGLIGEDPNGPPNNLMPYIAQVASGRLSHLSVYGNDYPTSDGTGVRDYIHVMDLAMGHLGALTSVKVRSGFTVLNLGTGKGISVIELVETFQDIADLDIPSRIVGRRSGDIAVCYADATMAQKMLDWQAVHSLSEMCSSTWKWQQYKKSL